MEKINIVKYFEDIKNYRQIGKIDSSLIDILKRFLKLENGIPYQDTFERVFRYLKSKPFEKCFLNLVKDLEKIKKK